MAENLPASLIDKLKAPLPPEAIGTHPTKNYLSTIKTIYQVERLNDVFGLNGWTAHSEIIEQNPPERLPPDDRNPEGKIIGGMIIMRVTLTVPLYGISLQQYGGNDNLDRGDAYKGAFTDALSKICGYLGIGMDIYKGEGPTKINPRGSKAASDAVRDRKLREIEDAKRAAARAVPSGPRYEQIDEEPPFPDDRYPDPPSELEQQLAASIQQAQLKKKQDKLTKFQILDLFKEIKAKFVGLEGDDKSYYKVLGLHGMEKSNDFIDNKAGRAKARGAFQDLQLKLEDIKAEHKKQSEAISGH